MALVAMTTTAASTMGRFDGPPLDDVSMAIQIQQFFDEWHYRALHSGVANDLDRSDIVAKAIELFECHGMPVAPEEKARLCEMDDEDLLVEWLVSRMPLELRRTFEQFALQLQVVVSTATRVRHALEEDFVEDLVRIFEDKDSGLGQDVLKQVVVEAGAEARELNELNGCWKEGTCQRISTLSNAAGNAEYAQEQLELVSEELNRFGGEQRGKSKKVLLNLADHNEEKLKAKVVRAWLAQTIQNRQEGVIRREFQDRLDETNRQLIAARTQQLVNVRAVMGRKTESGRNAILGEIFSLWRHNVEVDIRNREVAAEIEESQRKLHAMKNVHSDVARRTLMRLTDSDSREFLVFVFQAWSNETTMAREAQLHAEKLEAVKEGFAEYQLSRNPQTRSVLQRLCHGTEVGLLTSVMQRWRAFCAAEERAYSYQQAVEHEDQRFQHFALRQKIAAWHWSVSTNREEDLLFLQQIVDAWSTELQMIRVMEHYLGRANHKRAQLDAVQDMFKDFADQLEKGLGGHSPSRRRSKSALKDNPTSPHPSDLASLATGDPTSPCAAAIQDA